MNNRFLCNGCGNKYEDENGEKVIANFENWGVIDYQHDFSGEIVMNDATTHGFKCVNENCEKVGNFVSHEFDGWKADELEHWQECACGYEKSRDSHSGGTATCAQPAVCEVCEKTYGNALDHNHGTAWESDANEHYNECECGDKANKSAHADENNDGKCDVCEYQLSSGGNGGGNTGLSGGAIAGIAVGGVAVAGGGGFAIFWFVIKKKSFADLIAIFMKK